MGQLIDNHTASIDVHIADLIIATHDAADPQVRMQVREALQVLHTQLGMDAVFVSRNMAGTPAERCGLVEASWCEYIARSRGPRLPFDIGTFVSASVRLHGGLVYGMLGCISEDAQRTSKRDSHWLGLMGRLLAEDLEEREAQVPVNVLALARSAPFAARGAA